MAVRIPKAMARQARLEEGDGLALDVAKDGSIIIRSAHRKYTLKELVAAIRPTNRHAEIHWGRRRGQEVW